MELKTLTRCQGDLRGGVARLNRDGMGDPSFDTGPGVTAVLATALQPDGKVLIGGAFTTIGATARNRLARFISDGSLDRSFDPGTGANDLVTAIVLRPDGKVIVGGYFQSFNDSPRQHLELPKCARAAAMALMERVVSRRRTT